MLDENFWIQKFQISINLTILIRFSCFKQSYSPIQNENLLEDVNDRCFVDVEQFKQINLKFALVKKNDPLKMKSEKWYERVEREVFLQFDKSGWVNLKFMNPQKFL